MRPLNIPLLVWTETEIRVDTSFLVLWAGLLAVDAWGGRPHAIGRDTLLVILVLGSVLHMELARRWMLTRRGIQVREIVLTPWGGLLRTSRVAAATAERLSYCFGALAGALTHAALVGAAWAVWPRRDGFSWLGALTLANVVLAGVQLVPVLPFGAGRFLASRGGGDATERLMKASVWGRIVGFLVAVLGLGLGPLWTLSGVLLFMAAGTEARLLALGTARITGRFGQQY